jgi:hypothetical protein
MNVVGTTPDGWWRDRDGAVRRLLHRLQRLAAATAQPITLVLDGRARRDLPEGVHGGVMVTYPRVGGRGAGDDRLVELVADLADPAHACVITSDRGLAARVERFGASVRGATALLATLDGL